MNGGWIKGHVQNERASWGDRIGRGHSGRSTYSSCGTSADDNRYNDRSDMQRQIAITCRSDLEAARWCRRYEGIVTIETILAIWVERAGRRRPPGVVGGGHIEVAPTTHVAPRGSRSVRRIHLFVVDERIGYHGARRAWLGLLRYARLPLHLGVG